MSHYPVLWGLIFFALVLALRVGERLASRRAARRSQRPPRLPRRLRNGQHGRATSCHDTATGPGVRP